MDKPTSRLFQKVDAKVYNSVFKRLQKLRKKHSRPLAGKLIPTYRDDELLMWLACQYVAKMSNMMPKDW